jgi:hypothetical protein
MNIHTPERQPDESFLRYKARRNVSKRLARAMAGPQRSPKSATFAQVKRDARKRRNVLRNRRAHGGR